MCRYRSLALTIVLVWTANLAAQTPSSDADLIAALQRSVTHAIRQHEKSVVAIAVDRHRRALDDMPPAVQLDPAGLRRFTPAIQDDMPTYFGSGVVVDRRGLILTNYHVPGKEDEDYTVQHRVTTIDRKTYTAKVKAADRRSDLAILELVPLAGERGPRPIELTPVTFGDADRLQKGQFIIVLANPYAIARDGKPSAGWGLVANLQRKAQSSADADEYESPARPARCPIAARNKWWPAFKPRRRDGRADDFASGP
jgi:S1-C subfamily serine protease